MSGASVSNPLLVELFKVKCTPGFSTQIVVVFFFVVFFNVVQVPLHNRTSNSGVPFVKNTNVFIRNLGPAVESKAQFLRFRVQVP